MKCAAWRAFLGSFILFLLSCASCDYGSRSARRLSDELAAEGVFVCGGGGFPSEWNALGAMLLIASVSVAAGGAMRWWRAEVVGESDVRTLVLGINNEAAAADDGAQERIQDTAREGVAALPAAGSPRERAPAFEHFDERGRSPLERVLAGE